MANRHMERCSASLTREMQTQTTVRSHLTSSGWLSSERPQITSIVEEAGEGNRCALPAGVQTGAASVENSSAVSPKVKTELPCDPEIPLLGTYPEGKKETLTQKTAQQHHLRLSRYGRKCPRTDG